MKTFNTIKILLGLALINCIYNYSYCTDITLSAGSGLSDVMYSTPQLIDHYDKNLRQFFLLDLLSNTISEWIGVLSRWRREKILPDARRVEIFLSTTLTGSQAILPSCLK